MSRGDFISNGRISKKYELTSVLEDDEFMDDYFRGVLSDYTPEPPSKEDEYKSKRSSETSGVMDRRYGRASDNNVYQPDLFLGDMSRDPRSLMDSADLNGFRKHMEHRKEAIKINLLNDDDKSIHSKTMSHSENRKKKDEAFYRVRDKYTTFEEQTVNKRPAKMLGKLSKEGSSLAGYIINTHSSNYANREDKNKHSYFQNKVSGDREIMSLMDYTISRRGIQFGMEGKGAGKGMNMKKMNSNIRKGMNDTIDSVDKERLLWNERKNYALASKKALSIENFVESNKMYKSKEQLTGRVTNYTGGETYRIGSSNKEFGVNRNRLDDTVMEESISNRISNAANSIVISNRIIRNKEMAPVVAATAESLSNKTQPGSEEREITNNGKGSNNSSGDKVMSMISESIRASKFGVDKVTESKENIVSAKSGSGSKSSNIFSKNSVLNGRNTINTKGVGESISVFNYKTGKLQSIQTLTNSEFEESKKGKHISKETMDGGGMRRRARQYEQIGIANGNTAGDIKQSMKNAVSADRIMVRAAGSSGTIGRKFVRDKIERDGGEDERNGIEMTNIIKRY